MLWLLRIVAKHCRLFDKDKEGARARIAYVQQDDALLPTQTVRDALVFSAKLRSNGSEEVCCCLRQRSSCVVVVCAAC